MKEMCDHATIKENLSDYPVLKNLLPQEYMYHVCSFESLGENNFKAQMKLKLTRKLEVQKWQEDFQASSGLMWRKSKTYPDVGHGSNKYRVDLRCRHNTRSIKMTGQNTSCPAFMYVVLKRQSYSKGRKSRSEDAHVTEGYYCNIVLNNNHNHRIACAAALAKRDVSKGIEQQLKKLFESGRSPASALDTIKCSRTTQSSMVPVPPETQTVDELDSELALLFQYLSQKLRGNTPGFGAPVSSFIKSFKEMKTDSELQSALSTFGKTPMAKATGRQRSKGLIQSNTQIPVQPTAVARRKAHLGGRQVVTGRPSKVSKKDHPYLKAGMKPAAPHCLEHCVDTNTLFL